MPVDLNLTPSIILGVDGLFLPARSSNLGASLQKKPFNKKRLYTE
jgi:hypothetical protein